MYFLIKITLMMTKHIYLYDRFLRQPKTLLLNIGKLFEIPRFLSDFSSKFQVFQPKLPNSRFVRISNLVASLFKLK